MKRISLAKQLNHPQIVFPFHARIDKKNKKDRTGVCDEVCRPEAGPETGISKHQIFRKITEEFYLLFPKNIRISFFRTCTVGLEFN